MKCQVRDIVAAARSRRSALDRARVRWRAIGRFRRWQIFKLRRALAGLAGGGPAARPRGPTSLKAGDRVRVKSYEEIQKTLYRGKTADGLGFVAAPMRKYCGRTLRIERVLEHFYDETADRVWRKRRTVLLEGATCDSSQLAYGHCDRGCLLFWNEAWLEPVPEAEAGVQPVPASGERPQPAPRVAAAAIPPASARHRFAPGSPVRVRQREQIEETLDDNGTCDGTAFVAEHMAKCCGRIFTLAKRIDRFYDERDEYFVDLDDAYTLAGASCGGEQPGGAPRCDRACALIWHGSWLEPVRLDPAPRARERSGTA